MLIDKEKLLRAFAIDPKTEKRYPTKDVDGFYIDIHLKDVLQVILSQKEEITRCKNCKWYNGGWCLRNTDAFKPEDFCSYGEKKE